MTADDIRHRLAAAVEDEVDLHPDRLNAGQAVLDLAYLLDQLDTLRNAGQALAEVTEELGALIDAYLAERDSPAPDYGLRRTMRDQMVVVATAMALPALEGWRAACGNTTRQEEG